MKITRIMIVRKALAKDIKELVILARERDSGIKKPERRAYWNKKFKDLVKNKRILVADNDGSLSGFMYFSYAFLDYPAIYIELLFVTKSSRRQNVASMLIKSAEKIASKRKVNLWSSTDHDNVPSIKLHKKLGFKQAGYVKKPFPGEEKELFFCKATGRDM